MKVFTATVVLLTFIGTAYAFQCFVCNSEVDSACADEFKYDSPALQNAFTQNCTAENATEAGEPFCRKSKIYIEKPKTATIIRVYRDCGFMMREGYECYQKRSEDYVLDVCQCEEELCNGSDTLTFSLAPLLALTIPFFTRFL